MFIGESTYFDMVFGHTVTSINFLKTVITNHQCDYVLMRNDISLKKDSELMQNMFLFLIHINKFNTNQS